VVLEISPRFLENNQEYIGLDLSENMIALAQKEIKTEFSCGAT
jgi:ubiquinone/menaquinone biosynthesis C-methylase UbiE